MVKQNEHLCERWNIMQNTFEADIPSVWTANSFIYGADRA